MFDFYKKRNHSKISGHKNETKYYQYNQLLIKTELNEKGTKTVGIFFMQSGDFKHNQRKRREKIVPLLKYESYIVGIQIELYHLGYI